MKLIFLGTSAGIPSKNRGVTSLAMTLKNPSQWCLIDCGEGTQQQILKSQKLTLPKIQAIFITHLHGDHIYGLPGLLSSRSMQGGKSAVSLFGPLGLKKYLQNIFEISQVHLDYNLNIVEIPPEGQEFSYNSIVIKAIPLSHSVTSFAYFFQYPSILGKFNAEKAKECGIPFGPLWGQLKLGKVIKINGKNENGDESKLIDGKGFVGPSRVGVKIIVGGDNDQPQRLLPYLKGAHLFIHEATFTEEVKNNLPSYIQHSTPKIVAKVAEEAGVPHLILTHFSIRYYESTVALMMEAHEYYKGQLYLANDFDEFELSPDENSFSDYKLKLNSYF